MSTDPLILSVDAMGGDFAPDSILEGVALIAAEQSDIRILLHGDEAKLAPFLKSKPAVARICEIRHTDKTVAMDAKPTKALRSGKGSSMYNAIEAVKKGEASVAVSAGNTGALMAMSTLLLRVVEGVYRPAIAALWPTPEGRCVVLDVGANIEASAEQLVEFAIMGEAYSRAVAKKDRPSVGLLNIGSEDLKGHDDVRAAADTLRDPALELNFTGFVEGNDISMGVADVVVTDGFTGNVALKTAEGTARLVSQFVKEALTSGPLAKAGAVLAMSGLNKLKTRMDPRSVNGGVFLGLNGVVLKSHGGTDAQGFATTLRLASNVGRSHFREDVAASLLKYKEMRDAAKKEAVSA